jgi:predicted metal-dependent phosphoesterase TrpH
MVDLHCHTTASDGVLTPANLLSQAVIEGISVMAIADHDTVNGLDEAVQTARKKGICLIPAIELSLAYPNGILHLLGYGIQYEKPDFRDKLIWLKRIREERIIRIVEQLNLAGIELTYGDVQNELSGDAPGKPHVARALVKKGYAPDVSTALQTYLNKGTPGYVIKEKIQPEAAFELITGAGGFPVLAHPKSLNCKSPEEYDQFIQKYMNLGLAGIEVYASIHNDEDVALFGELAKRHKLITTGGSDFHGDNGRRLGYYGECRPIPESCSKPLLQLIGN